MLSQLCFPESMDKSIFTPEQIILQGLLRQIRLGAGLRQEDLAERLEEPQSFVSKYESGERRLDLIELRQICQAVGVTLLELVRRYEEQIQSCAPTQNLSDSPKSFGLTSEQ
jgi:transcriptional regulator with XRE-family HTH domain